MENGLGRIARSALAPRAIILGVSAFQFGLSLSEWMRPTEGYSNHRDEFAQLFLASTILAAAACLAARRASGNLLAAFLSGPLTLLQALIFFEAAHRAKSWPFSGAHINIWARELAGVPADIWLATALSFAVLACAIASTLRPSPKP